MKEKVVLRLAVKLQKEETEAFGAELLRELGERGKLNREVESLKEQTKARIKVLEGEVEKKEERIEHLRSCLVAGTETRDVSCYEVIHWDNALVGIFRGDTDERVDVRPIRPEERQMRLRDLEKTEQARAVEAAPTTTSEGVTPETAAKAEDLADRLVVALKSRDLDEARDFVRYTFKKRAAKDRRKLLELLELAENAGKARPGVINVIAELRSDLPILSIVTPEAVDGQK